jgi:hypothetical protein
MTLPNFFIAGTPKAATTALAQYLSLHPDCFMSDPKEPHHFNDDHRHGGFKDAADYRRLFSQAPPGASAIGEASPLYLYSDRAVPRIERELPGARYIVMLRNPVDMAPALHEQHLFSGYENTSKFADAWALEAERKSGRHLPPQTEPKLLYYRDICRVGAQYQRFCGTVAAERRLLIFFDDFRSDPRAVWQKVQAFLGLDDDGRTEFPTVNAAKKRKSLALQRIKKGISTARRRIGLKSLNSGVLKSIERWNVTERRRAPLDPELREELLFEFAEDIALLERETGRDLAHWRGSAKADPA